MPLNTFKETTCPYLHSPPRKKVTVIIAPNISDIEWYEQKAVKYVNTKIATATDRPVLSNQNNTSETGDIQQGHDQEIT